MSIDTTTERSDYDYALVTEADLPRPSEARPAAGPLPQRVVIAVSLAVVLIVILAAFVLLGPPSSAASGGCGGG